MSQYPNNQYRSNQYAKPTNAIGTIVEELKKHQKPISECFTKKDLYLPEGKAHVIANNLRDMKVNQIRKIFDMISKADELAKSGKFEQASEALFMVVPMVAYATGRELIRPTEFNDFIQTIISDKRIKSAADVSTLHLFMQSILAYTKAK